MEASGGIHYHVVHSPRLCGLQCIEENRSRITAGLGLDNFSPGAFSPNLELLNGCGSKRVSCAQQHSLPFTAKDTGKFPDRRSLPCSIYSDNENDFRFSVYRLNRLHVCPGEYIAHFFLKQSLQVSSIGNLLAICLFTQTRKQLLGSLRTQIGADQGRLQIIECAAIDFLAKGDDVVDTFAEILSRTRNSLLHTFKQALFF